MVSLIYKLGDEEIEKTFVSYSHAKNFVKHWNEMMEEQMKSQEWKERNKIKSYKIQKKTWTQ
jgi:hypothetical protein